MCFVCWYQQEQYCLYIYMCMYMFNDTFEIDLSNVDRQWTTQYQPHHQPNSIFKQITFIQTMERANIFDPCQQRETIQLWSTRHEHQRMDVFIIPQWFEQRVWIIRLTPRSLCKSTMIALLFDGWVFAILGPSLFKIRSTIPFDTWTM